MRNRSKQTEWQSISLGRLQPQAKEFEEAVLGALMVEKSAFDNVSFLQSKMFYERSHELIFEAIAFLSKQGKPVDILTVTEQLRNTGNLDDVGGAFYITQLSGKVASSVHIEYHAKIIKQKYIQREAIRIASEIQMMAYDDTQDIEDVLFKSGNDIQSLQEDLVGQGDIKSFSEISTLAMEDIERKMVLYSADRQTGVPTGLCDLNRITSGWQNSELVIIAARPAMGKTALSLHFAKAAASSGIPVAFFSLEMSDISLYNRLLLSECDVNPEHLKSGNISPDDLSKIDNAAARLYNLPLYVDDNANASIAFIHSRCRLLKKQKKCGMVVIDYLQLTAESKSTNRTREQEVTQMSREAKLMAKELDIPVLLLSQLSRKVEDRQDKRPMLNDLRESGSIEQDADMVLFIYRPEYYGITPKNKDTGRPEPNTGMLIIAKNRNGKTCDVKFTHNNSLTKIYDYDTFGYTSMSNAEAVNHYYEPSRIEDNNPF